MSGRWFRFYDDTINDPKALKLSDRTFRVWIGLLCLASKNGGVLPPFDDMVILLRMKAGQLQPELERLIEVELLDHDDNGIHPHNWNTRQYKSDVSTERVKRFRNSERNVSETVNETPPETEEQNTETEKKDIRSVAVATRPPSNSDFDEFWKVYPKRAGSNPRAHACKKFVAIVRSGADPQAIIAAAKRYSSECREQKIYGSSFVAQAITWLNQQRFDDYQPPPLSQISAPVPGLPTDDELRKKYGQANSAVQTQTETARANRNGADHEGELRREGAEICPSLRPF